MMPVTAFIFLMECCEAMYMFPLASVQTPDGAIKSAHVARLPSPWELKAPVPAMVPITCDETLEEIVTNKIITISLEMIKMFLWESRAMVISILIYGFPMG